MIAPAPNWNVNVRYALTRRPIGGAAVLLAALLAVGAGVQLFATGSAGEFRTALPALVAVLASLAVVLAAGLSRVARGRTAYW